MQRDYNGLSQLVREYQEHAGAVNVLTTPKVQYVYSEMGGAANHSRLTSMIYPNGRALVYLYGPGLDDSISRLTSIVDGLPLEELAYLGLGTVVRRAHLEPNVDQTFIQLPGEGIGEAGDQYVGLDRFGRFIDHRWMKNGAQRDRYQYTYDRNSNRTSKLNAIEAALNELYTYDSLNQLLTFTRANGHSQSWDMDGQGNFQSVTTDGSPESRTHNAQNELTNVAGNGLTFDGNGNMTTDEMARALAFDAWNRLAGVDASGGGPIIDFTYDGLNRRQQEIRPSETRDLFYSAEWQILEERVAGAARVQNVWSPVYVDAMVLRDRDTDNNGTLDERLYVMQDANFNVTGVVNTNGAVQERYIYDPYGAVIIAAPNWNVRPVTLFVWNNHHQGLRFVFDVGLMANRERDYSPSLQRFGKLDPIRLAGGLTNLYVYEGNGPTGALDPLGLVVQVWTFEGARVIGFGGDFLRRHIISGLASFLGKGFTWHNYESTIPVGRTALFTATAQARRLARAEEKKDDPCYPRVAVIGFSWGGESAIRLARNLNSTDVCVDLLYTIDPVPWGFPFRGRDAEFAASEMPRNVGLWVNFFQRVDKKSFFEGHVVGSIYGRAIPVPFTAGVFNFEVTAERFQSLRLNPDYGHVAITVVPEVLFELYNLMRQLAQAPNRASYKVCPRDLRL